GERARANEAADDRLAHRSTTEDPQDTVVVQHALGPSTGGHAASAGGRAAHRGEAGNPGGDPRWKSPGAGAADVSHRGDGAPPAGRPADPPRLQPGGGAPDRAP